MVWLYRLQQRLSITQQEGLAVIVLTFLFLVGLGVRHVQEQRIPPVQVDSLVARPGATALADSATTAANGGASAPTPEDPVHLNAASAERLRALDGIGSALSKRIVEYRSTQRPFQRIQELRRVRGIGPQTLATLRPVVTVAEAETSR